MSWTSELDDVAREQAQRHTRSPTLADHAALLRDAHLGIGATNGTALATRSAAIQVAVGVDRGCGVDAVETDRVKAEPSDGLGPALEECRSSNSSDRGAGVRIDVGARATI